MDLEIVANKNPEESLIKKIEEISKNEIIKKGWFSIAFSGGSTPIKLFSLLSDSSVLWEKTKIFFVDERFVSIDHEDSNYGLLKKSLLDNILIPQENVIRVETERDINIAVKLYKNEVDKILKRQNYLFDVIILGIGNDGHTASVFPGKHKDTKSNDSVILASSTNHKHERITITLDSINKCKNIFFFVKGDEKREIVKEVITGENKNFPASFVSIDNGNIYLITDLESTV